MLTNEFPPKVNESVPDVKDNVPVNVRLLLNVIAPVKEVVILFQVIPLVLRVVATLIFKVEPVVTTVPAVYVKVPVL